MASGLKRVLTKVGFSTAGLLIVRPLIVRWWLLLCIGLGTQVWAGEYRPIDDFFGQYIGHVSTSSGLNRDISVTIGSAGKEVFFVSWTTVSHKPKGPKRKDYQIKFQPSERDGIYASAMKTNVFGGSVSLDPMAGEPFVWARIKGDTLTVHTMLITEDGGYEMQIYNRTLNAEGLLLDYRRLRTGEELRKLTAQLVRVAD